MPVYQIWIPFHTISIFAEINLPILSPVKFIENRLKRFLLHSYMRVDQWAPVCNNFLEVGPKFCESNDTLFMQIHQSEWKLIPLIIIPVYEEVGEASELGKGQVVVVV